MNLAIKHYVLYILVSLELPFIFSKHQNNLKIKSIVYWILNRVTSLIAGVRMVLIREPALIEK
jgi:hypothetical protein